MALRAVAAGVGRVRDGVRTGGGGWFNDPAFSDQAVVADLNNDQYAVPNLSVAEVATATTAQLLNKRSATFDEVFAFTASSTTARTYIASGGTLKNDLAANARRMTYANGRRQLRLEDARTNIVLQSQNQASASWSKNNATVGAAVTSPDGTANAFPVTYSAQYGQLQQILTVPNGVTYTYSVWLRAVSGNTQISLVQSSGTTTFQTVTVTPVWTRFSYTFTTGSTGLSIYIQDRNASGFGQIEVFGAQVELGPFASNYIPTTTTAVTRAIEAARFSPLVEAILQRTAASIVVRGQGLQTLTGRLIGGAGSVGVISGQTSSTLRATDGATTLDATIGEGLTTASFGAAASFDASGRSLVGGAGTVVSDATAVGSLTSIYLGRDANNTVYGAGYYDAVLIAPSRLDNARLQALSVDAATATASSPFLAAADPALSRSIPCDYYCDSVNGNDANSGTSPVTAFATISAALTAIGTTANKSIGLIAGSVFRPSASITPVSAGLTIRAYGPGATPEILGSTLIVGTWSVVTGTEFQTPITYTPRTAFWVNASTGAITKLRPGTAGALASNQYAVSGGNLSVNIGKDPTGERIEVAKDAASFTTHILNVVNKADHAYIGLAVKFGPFSGISFDVGQNATVNGCVVSYNGDDGIDLSSGASAMIKACTIQWNGYQARGGGGGPGDGISAHGGSSVVIESCIITDNDQTGVGNVSDTFCITRYCYLRNNPTNINVYNSNTAAAGSHLFQYNVIACPNGSNGVAINIAPSAVSTVSVALHNNTIHSEDGSHFILANLSGGTCTLKNNIFSGNPQNGIANYNGLSNNVCIVSADYNLYQAGARYQSGYGPQTVGSNEASGNPLYYDASTPGSQNFRLLTGSPAKATGTDLGYTRDYVGVGVPFVAGSPCRGAFERRAT